MCGNFSVHTFCFFFRLRVLCIRLVDGVRAVGKPVIIFSILKTVLGLVGGAPGGKTLIDLLASILQHAS